MRTNRVPTVLVAVALVATTVVTGAGAQTTTTATPEPSASFTHEGDELVVEPAPGQRLEGETSLPGGTRLTLRIQSSNTGSPFLNRVETTVGDGGTFTTAVDFGQVEVDTSFTVKVRYNATTIAETTGRVVACAQNCTETPGESNATTTEPTDTDTLEAATPTAPLDDTTPAPQRSIDIGGVGALGAGLLLGVVGVALLLGLGRE